MSILGLLVGISVSVVMSFYVVSFMVWCSVVVSVGILFWISFSLLSSQLESVVCISVEMMSSSFGSAMILLTLWVYMLSIFVSDAASKKMLGEGYLGLLGVLTLVCCLFFSMSDFFYMYLFFEGVLIPIIFMILGWGRQPERFEAGLYMLIYTIMGSLPLLMCLLWFWSVDVSSFFLLKSESGSTFEGGLVVFMVSLAFCVKMPIFGVHGWLPKAHVEAPVAGSMMLAGIMLKMGVYGLVVFYWFIQVKYVWMMELLMGVSSVGGVISGVVCMFQSDMKALIAYSSVSHMCFLMIGLISMGWLGWEGVILMSLSHGICSPWLFFMANYLSDLMGTRSLYLLKGVLLGIPLMSLMMFLGVCGNMAVPPCVALVGELSLFISGSYFSMFLVVPMMMMCFFAAAYSLGMYSSVSHGGMIVGTKMEGSMSSRCVLGSVLIMIPLSVGILMVDMFGVGG